MSRKKFEKGQHVEVQVKVDGAWEPATYQNAYSDWRGWHSVRLTRQRRMSSQTGNETSVDDPQGFLTDHVSVPTQRLRVK
jgi:ferredoxin-NADP reductase